MTTLISRLNFRTLFGLSGWVAAIVMGASIAPKVYRRWVGALPSIQEKRWASVLEAKRLSIASSNWADPRPLHVFAGDSHIANGSWYDLFRGAIAIRNVGLSEATIGDTEVLIQALPDRNLESVVLMCGVNDLGRDTPPDQCLAAYSRLLTTVKRLNPKRIYVLSVLPVRSSAVERRNAEINRNIAALNAGLIDLSSRLNAIYVDLVGAVAGPGGSLSESLTYDGLHLNPSGYENLARQFASVLMKQATP